MSRLTIFVKTSRLKMMAAAALGGFKDPISKSSSLPPSRRPNRCSSPGRTMSRTL
jgi:hypothetical protein